MCATGFEFFDRVTKQTICGPPTAILAVAGTDDVIGLPPDPPEDPLQSPERVKAEESPEAVGAGT